MANTTPSPAAGSSPSAGTANAPGSPGTGSRLPICCSSFACHPVSASTAQPHSSIAIQTGIGASDGMRSAQRLREERERERCHECGLLVVGGAAVAALDVLVVEDVV